jgi:8-hydroxy-5-deazaflavin:NADPH oxidoreductase
VLRLAGGRHLAGKILIDVANALDFSHGMPPTLFVKDTDSLAEQIQREFPTPRSSRRLTR